MGCLVEPHADQPAGLKRLSLGLHATHGELTGVVQRLREVRHLHVATDLPHRLHHALAGDVVDAVAHHQADGAVAGAQQGRKVLAAEVGGERAPTGSPMQLPAGMLDRGADGDELGQVGAPVVAADRQPHADDAVGAELIGFLLHARHRELAGVVHRLGQNLHLHVLVPVRLLEADVVDRAAKHEPERLEP